jgi:hypothetical protein
MPSQVVQSGEYTLELDTGFTVNGFTLDNPTSGMLDNTLFVLDGTTQFADITEYVTNVSYTRGRRKTDYQFGAGMMNFTMIDETGILGPYDSTSPYYDPANQEPGLAPMRQVRLKRENTYIFTGTVMGYDYEFAKAGYNTVNVQCADDFYKLAQTQMAAFNPSPELSGARINTVLALPEVDYNGTTDIDPGTVSIGHDSAYDVDAGTNTLAYLQQINQAEQGRLFMAADGELVFQPRIGNTLQAPTVEFTDNGTGTKYTDLAIAFDADDVINRVYIQALDGKTATDTDAASIAKYFTQSLSITNSLLHDQSEIDDLAAYLLEPEPAPRYTSLTTTYSRLTEAERDDVTALDIGDTISITKDIPNLLTPIESTLSIEGIQGNINVTNGHTITFYTSAAALVYALILDDAIYGKLDSNNAVA